MLLEDIVSVSDQFRRLPGPEMDPFTETDALLEAQLVDVRLNAWQSDVSLLFELRMSLDVGVGNTGVLAASGVRKVAWKAEERDTDKTAWNVVGSTPETEDGLLTLTIDMLPEAHLTLTAASMAFFVVRVPGLSDTPPDYGDPDDIVQAQMPGWDSSFEPLHGAFFEPTP